MPPDIRTTHVFVLAGLLLLRNARRIRSRADDVITWIKVLRITSHVVFTVGTFRVLGLFTQPLIAFQSRYSYCVIIMSNKRIRNT